MQHFLNWTTWIALVCIGLVIGFWASVAPAQTASDPRPDAGEYIQNIRMAPDTGTPGAMR